MYEGPLYFLHSSLSLSTTGASLKSDLHALKGWGLQPGMGNEEQQEQCPFWIPAQTIHHRQDLCISTPLQSEVFQIRSIRLKYFPHISLQHWQTGEP